MAKMIEVKLYGELSKAAQTSLIQLEISEAMTAAQVKDLIKSKILKQVPGFQEELIDVSALGERRIFPDSEVIGEVDKLSLLPPVCGG